MEAEVTKLFFSALEWEEKAYSLSGYVTEEDEYLLYYDIHGDLAGSYHLQLGRGWIRL